MSGFYFPCVQRTVFHFHRWLHLLSGSLAETALCPTSAPADLQVPADQSLLLIGKVRLLTELQSDFCRDSEIQSLPELGAQLA